MRRPAGLIYLDVTGDHLALGIEPIGRYLSHRIFGKIFINGQWIRSARHAYSCEAAVLYVELTVR